MFRPCREMPRQDCWLCQCCFFADYRLPNPGTVCHGASLMQHSSLNLKFQATKWPQLSMQKDFWLSSGGAFGAKITPLIGVDISSTSVKLVELAGTRQNLNSVATRLSRYHAIRLPTAISPMSKRLALPSNGLLQARLAHERRCCGAADQHGHHQTDHPARYRAGRRPRIGSEGEAKPVHSLALDEVNLDYAGNRPWSPTTTPRLRWMIAAARREKGRGPGCCVESAGLAGRDGRRGNGGVVSAYELMAEALPGKGSTRTSGCLTSGATRHGSTCSATTSRFSCAKARSATS